MKKLPTFHFLFSLLLLLLAAACEMSSLPLLQKAKEMQKISTDSVFFYLQQIKHPEELTNEQQGDYCLLLYRTTLQKTGEVKDSLLKAAFLHYEQSPNPQRRLQVFNERALSYVYHNLPDSALSVAETIFHHPHFNDTLRMNLYGICREAYIQKKDYPEALKAADSCRQIATQLKDTFSYFRSSQRYLSILNLQGEEEKYICQSHALIDCLDTSARFRHLSYYILESLVQSCLQRKEFDKALHYSRQLSHYRHSRYEVPYYLMLKAEVHEALHHPDSAKYYYTQAVNSASGHLAIEANARLLQIACREQLPEQAYYLQAKEEQLKENILNHLNTEINRKEFTEMKLQNELYSLRLNQQKKELWMMGIVIILLLIGFVALLFYHQEKKKRLQGENQLLHQEAELSALREKEMLMRNKETELREALFRRISFFHKLPSLHHTEEKEEEEENISNRRITVSNAEWEEVKTAINDAFDNFVLRLQSAYPQLGNKDIYFCCLVKINVNLQDLSDIYCVSKAAITKRKYRIKKDKLGITDENISLDAFLQSF